jgi:amino acid adenylation domain-containing protein
MNDSLNHGYRLPPEQQAIRDKCFHPSGTFVEFPIEDVETSIPERFEKVVSQYPDNWAIVTNSQSLTYGELNACANRAARAIIERFGRGSEPVALLFDSKPALIVAMLAAMKAEKFFVLLDPAIPKTRSRNIIADARARCLLVEQQTGLLGRELADGLCRLLDLATTERFYAADNPRLLVSPESLASISYTSGSTGEPKGVIWTHRNMLHQVMLFTNEFHHGDRDRLSYLTSGTAAAVLHPFLALLVGAVVLPFDVKRHGIEALITWLIQKKVSVCSLSAPLFRSLAAILMGRERFSDLRLLRISSEAVYKTDFELYRQFFPATCLLGNGVSPAETCLLSSYLMDHDSMIDSDEIPIGYPVPGKDILLLDDTGKSVGVNQVGEIVVRSSYLSPGYWNRADLTDERFEPDPLGGTKRLYRTRDLGLLLPDGCLIHKGRKDYRAKIRGYGVEVAEVESALRPFPGILDVVVVALKHEPAGENRLIAYFVATENIAPNSNEWRNFLKSRLPEYMIPAVFIQLESLPLTVNGKVDRRALPAPDRTRPGLGTRFVAPESSLQQRLAEIWGQVLGVGGIGAHDNFFDLGGDSLSAMRVVVRINEVLESEIPLSEFFNAPTINALADFVPRYSLAHAIRRAPLLASSNRALPLPLSFGQERLWFLEQLEPEACRHNLVAAFAVNGRIDTAALECAFNEIIKRHESLRTVFRSTDGKPHQEILAALTIDVPIVDMSSSIADANWAGSISRFCASQAQQAFNLSQGPLLRVKLVRFSSERSVLILVVHHLIFDGWSMDILGRELTIAYELLVNKQPLQFESVPIQYADFAVWQHHSLQTETLNFQLAYWRGRLAGIADLRLPMDRPRPGVRDGKGARHWFTLTPTVTQSLKEISRDADVTLFMALLAAYQTLLSRYSGQDDFCIGVPMAVRQDGALDHTIGFFLNLLTLRSDLSGNPKFADLLARVRQRCLEAYAQQDLPFERLVQELQISRDINQNPLFQASFTLRNSSACPLALTGLEVQELELDPGTTRFDIELFLEERENGLHGFIAYSTDVFDASTIERMAGHFQTLLKDIVENPQCPIADLSILTDPERDQLLVEWNDTKRADPKDKCIHEVFEEQVVRAPDALAVIFENQRITYRELNKRANQLAHYLRKRNVGPEVLVGICIDRSIEMIVAVLGVLKAGGAYVPLDPSYPAERLEFMLADAQAALLLTRGKSFEDREVSLDDTARRSILDPHMRRVCLDSAWQLIAKESDANPGSSITPDNLAYVIYTSGSTGQPKGVAIGHRNTVAFLSWVRSAFTQEELSGVLASTSICFDLSIFEIFAPLTCGGTIIMAENALALTTIPNKSNVSLLNTVPSAINELLRLEAIPSTVRVINLAGELLRPELVRRIYESTSVRKVHDLYGPSECTTYSTWTCRTVDGPQTIGRPIANTQIFILDAHRNPVPIGVVGEIYVGGDGVARGYLNRPEVTAERFIYHSFDGEPVRRLYKTGDLARYLPDGDIEFLGRVDNQVKVRGYRIELGEIEAVLGQHPMVQSSVVVVREDTPGDKRLVGYVVARAKGSFDASQVRQYLQHKLPEYMIPVALMPLDELPLTPSGKVDRRALPAPDQNGLQLANVCQPPRTPIEETLVAIWGKVLKLDKVGIYDNFFDLGGHSLLATQIMSRIRSAFSIDDLPLRHMFESPTVAEMAVIITQTQWKQVSEAELAQILREVEATTEEDAEKLLTV